jgi:hypothetical protein
MARHILMVLSNAKEGRDEEFNAWYDNTHLGDVLKVEGFTAAQRFKLADSQMMPGCPYGYLAIYEVETENLEQSVKALGASVGQMVITEAMDVANTAMWTFSPITKRVPA